MDETPSTSPAATEPGLRAARGVFLVVALLVAAALAHGWGASILDRHEARQVQTMLSAQWIRAEGVSLAYPLPIFGPPWSAPMEFPLYQTVVAGLAGATGWSLEACARGVSVASFVALLPAVWGLLGLAGLARAGRWLALAVFVSAPVFLFYARTVLIESTALCLAGWFLYAFLRGVRGGGARWVAAAAGVGALAAAVKVTTLAPFCVVGALAAAREWRARRTWRGLAGPVLAPAGAVLVAAWAWVAFSDAVKASNPFSVFLTSAELGVWNFGTLAQRVSAPFWNQLYGTTTHSVLAEGALAGVLGLAVLARRPARGLALALAGAYLSGPLLFANLYFVHDYYYFAVAPLLVGAAGVLLADVAAQDGFRRRFALAWLVLLLVQQGLAYHRGYAGNVARETAPRPELAALVAAAVAPDETVFIGGWDWNMTLPYYSGRRALMPRGRENDLPAITAVAAKIGPAKITAAVWRGSDGPPAALRAWWVEQLELLEIPAATEGDLQLFVRPAVLEKLAASFDRGGFSRAQLHLRPAARPWDGELREQAWTQDATPGPAFPAPFKARSFHGCGVYVTGGERRIIAHAVTELFIHPPAGARRIVAEFRLLPEAYTRTEPGDGADVEIFEEVRGGARRRLFRRHLEPAKRTEDRGDLTVELTGFGPLAGDLVFAVTPGDAGRADYDWCDWKRIVVE